mmetsp:Transcript_2301/g.4185  ORF Transcript_2301/g.4185 Transcript_2301/m.4185 type:complete len:778 (-) Transcript_2301:676-3009(-)
MTDENDANSGGDDDANDLSGGDDVDNNSEDDQDNDDTTNNDEDVGRELLRRLLQPATNSSNDNVSDDLRRILNALGREAWISSSTGDSELMDSEEEETETHQRQGSEEDPPSEQSPLTVRATIRNDGTVVFFYPPQDQEEDAEQQRIVSNTDTNNEGMEVTNNAHNHSDEEVEDIPNGMTPARMHAYLPGTSHPLFPENLLEQQRRKQSLDSSRQSSSRRRRRRIGSHTQLTENEMLGASINNDGATTTEDLMSLNNVNREEREEQSILLSSNGDDDSSESSSSYSLYGQEQEGDDFLDAAVGQGVLRRPTQELAILELDDVTLFPGSTLPLRLRNPDWVNYLGRKIDDARGLTTTGYQNGDQVRIGVLTRVPKRRARQYQQQRLERDREQLRQQQQRGRRRNEARSREDSREGASQSSVSHNDDLSDVDSDTGYVVSDGIDTDAAGSHSSSTHQQRELRQGITASPTDPLIGRIGTIATITYTHEQALDESNQIFVGDNIGERSRVWQSHREGQLVVTALGTDRFRILAGIEDGSNYNGSTSHRHHRRHHYGDMADIRLYEVEELNEANLPLPPVSLRHMTCFASHSGTGNNANDAAEDIGSSMFLERQSRMRDTLASVSPLPAFAYQIVWPWRLMDLIQHALSDTSGWDGVKRYNQDGSRDGIPQNPTQFSFWVAANMPLSEAEKLELLDMNCTVKRLRFLYEKLLEEKRNMRSIFCKRCGTRISNVASMFTVGGAEGTTGAYVNEHGVIHQTITLRSVTERSIMYHGGAETKDR